MFYDPLSGDINSVVSNPFQWICAIDLDQFHYCSSFCRVRLSNSTLIASINGVVFTKSGGCCIMSEVVVFVVRRDKTDLVDSLSRENASARMVVAVIRSVLVRLVLV